MADYEPDDGPLTDGDLQRITQAASKCAPKGKLLCRSRSLIDPTTVHRILQHVDLAPERYHSVSEILAEMDREVDLIGGHVSK